MTRLREAGVSPAPSEKQGAEVLRLIELIGIGPEEAAALAGLPHLDALKTAAQASKLIDALRERLPEVTKPTDKQLRFIGDLTKKRGLTEAQACALVGEESFDALTGGRNGSASRLITALKREIRGQRVRWSGTAIHQQNAMA